MKRCPTCDRMYSDETLSYCLEDGSVLVADVSSAETQRIPAARITNLPTEIMQAPRQQAQATAPMTTLPPARHNQTLLYVVIALLALIAGGFAVAWLTSTNKERAQEEKPRDATSNSAPKQEAAQATATPAPQSTSSPALTEEAVRNLIERWRLAQNSKDFAAYQSCYDQSFEGIKRTASGREVKYDYSGWMQDRRRMMNEALGLNVEVRSLQVSVNGDTAEVSFTQTYRSASYSDEGRKLMRVRRTAQGDKIVYEDLKDSHPI